MNMPSAEFSTSDTTPSHESESIGGTVLMRALADENVEFIWGYPGGSVLYIYDELYKQDQIQHILVRHEQAAVHAADAYARATGNVGVCLVTSGPGVTNAVTGIATAYMDSIPMVVISGQVPTAAIGLDAFQECDTVGITRPCVKHNFLVKDVRDLAATVKKAFYIARTGRPGPVLIDIPKDVSKAPCKYEPLKTVSLRSYNPVTKGHSGQIRKAVQLLLSAKRPYIYTGGGIILADASRELNQFADLLGYPVTNTLMGLGGYRASDKKFLGMLGMHGTYEANMAMQNCDVLIAIGARFDDRVIGDPEAFRLVAAQDHPYRCRSVVHFQAREGGHPHRRRREGSAEGTDRTASDRRPRPRHQGARGLVEGHRSLALERLPRLRPQERHHQAAVRGRKRRGRLTDGNAFRLLRRRPAPDVGGAVLSLQQAAPLDQFRRARHDGLRPAGGDGREDGFPRRGSALHHGRRL